MKDKDEEVLLRVEDLRIAFGSPKDCRQVINEVSFTVRRSSTLGIVGESGSGKSVSSLAIMGLLPTTARVTQGHAWLHIGNEVIDLFQQDEHAMQRLRGRHIAMIFQEPMTSLNPVQRCGDQVAEMLQQHLTLSHHETHRRVLDLFDEVMLPRPKQLYRAYPHELSGGQKQRVMIAMALACRPDLIIADEPTTALDVTVQKTILDLLRSLQQRHGMSIIFVSHDLGVIANIADQVAVMYHGTIVEQGDAHQVLHHPHHPYTQGLLACRPPLDTRPRHLPTVTDFLEGLPVDTSDTTTEPQPPTNPPLLSVRNLKVEYVLKKNLWGKPLQTLRAVDDISFDVYPGETFGLVGESGCGKTTLGRTLLGLIEASAGTVSYKGQCLNTLSQRELRHMRTQMQIVFQDPYSSLNPRLTIGEAIIEPLRCHHRSTSEETRRQQVLQLMEQVGLNPDWYNRYPHEFSGGQRQRVCIARALILEPELVICDESVSALDVSVQAQVLNLLNDLKQQYHYTYIFISHDLSVVRYLSDRIMVMQQGHIVELNTADTIFHHPQQPYTQRLLNAIPTIN